METSENYSRGATLALIVVVQVLASLVLAIPIAMLSRGSLTAGNLPEILIGLLLFALSLLVAFGFLSHRITSFDKQDLGIRLAVIYFALGLVGMLVAGLMVSTLVQTIIYPAIAYGLTQVYPKVLPKSICPTCRV